MIYAQANKKRSVVLLVIFLITSVFTGYRLYDFYKNNQNTRADLMGDPAVTAAIQEEKILQEQSSIFPNPKFKALNDYIGSRQIDIDPDQARTHNPFTVKEIPEETVMAESSVEPEEIEE